MNKYDKRTLLVSTSLFLMLYVVLLISVFIGAWTIAESALGFDQVQTFIASSAVTGVTFIISTWMFARLFTKPLRIVAEHLSSFKQGSADIDAAKGYAAPALKAIFRSITDYIHQLQNFGSQSSQHAKSLDMALDALPHPVFGVNMDYKIIYANAAALDLLMIGPDDLEGTRLSEALNLRKNDEPLLEPWILTSSQNTINAEQHWQEIEFNSPSHQVYNFDIYARYKKNEDINQPETVIMLEDRTLERESEFTKVDFVAMAVHELRAPLTVIRGYIEVIEDELSDRMSPEEKQFLAKLDASGRQLSSFVSNILRTARADHNNLKVNLEKRDWPTVLNQALQDISIRAEIHGKKLQVDIQEDIPEVAVDPISITEVVTNLVDNAIKYSKDQEVIVVKSYLNDSGFVETIVQDFGVGIPANLVDKLFTKFYRSHHTDDHFAGSGLGLYISRAIVKAHHGDVWVKSEEGKGSTFGFTLPQFSQIADKLTEDGETKAEITRGKHGWIKNHSLYRR